MDLDREHLGEQAEPLADPLPPMPEIFPRAVVLPPKEGAPHARGNTVENPAPSRFDKSAVSSCHSAKVLN